MSKDDIELAVGLDNHSFPAGDGIFPSLKQGVVGTIHVGLVPTVEKLLYLALVEVFVLFVVFTHYPKLDERNQFLTPLVTGAMTSFMGQTLTSLIQWVKACGHIRGSTSQHPTLPSVWRNHCKFLLWGGISGLLTNWWIELLVSSFPEKRYMCVILDQTVATFFFQSLFVLFSMVWDVEFSQAETPSWRQCISLCWKLVKLSYLVWPYVSVFCFTWAPKQWIFPINCLFSTLFSVILAMTAS